MSDQPQVNLLFANQGEHLRTVRDFQDLRGAKARPTDLTCPECGHGVTVKLSPARQIADHFAHLPDANCRLQNGGESAAHLNAKAGLSLWMGRYHKMALSHKCVACQRWETFLQFEEYDQVIPELKLGKRRPDISMLNGGETVGAAEVKHTHGVTAQKQYDFQAMRVRWFEIPTAGAHKRFYNVAAHISDWFTIDARAAGVTYPFVPSYCEVCAAQRRRDEEKLAASHRFQDDWKRIQAAIPVVDRHNWDRAAMEAAVAKLREDDERRKLEAQQHQAERDIWEQRDGAAFLTETNELRIPRFSEFKFRWWDEKRGGQSLYKTLAELNAPLSTWKRHAYEDTGLLTETHRSRCAGTVQRADGFSFCADCGYYLEGAMVNV